MSLFICNAAVTGSFDQVNEYTISLSQQSHRAHQNNKTDGYLNSPGSSRTFLENSRVH